MSGPVCLNCGAHIRKRTQSHQFWLNENGPRSKDDAQRMFNEKVVAISYWPDGSARTVHTWDGESYIDRHFCSNKCAENFGRWAARHGVRRRP